MATAAQVPSRQEAAKSVARAMPGHVIDPLHASQSLLAHAADRRSASTLGMARGGLGQHEQHPDDVVTTQSLSAAQETFPPAGVREGAAPHATKTSVTTAEGQRRDMGTRYPRVHGRSSLGRRHSAVPKT